MATFSTFLGLKLNSSSDPFLLSDFLANWTILDGAPGVFVCTSSTRPTLTGAQAGRLIFMTDWECLSFWNGTAWLDARDAVPVFAAGAAFSSSVAHNTSATFTVISLTLPRQCSLVISVTGTYQCPTGASQDVFQRVLVDGVGSTANQLGGFREQGRFSGIISGSAQAGLSLTTHQVIASVAPGSHTIGLGVDIGGASNTPVTVVGAKALAWIAVTAANNSL
jgi:hypothetical protein